MCGISGFIGIDPTEATIAVQVMNDAMVHRGPDAGGNSLERIGNSWLALGHRRLSILDLSPLGNQPMVSDDQSAIIVFNGEIYNFQRLRERLARMGCKFRSGSDTEVLLYGLMQFGKKFIEELEGMYAFAFFDRKKQTLTLARDPAGIKPLYYVDQTDHFVFASELKPLLATGKVSRKLSVEAVDSFLAYGAVAQPLSIVEDVKMLEAGCRLEIRCCDGLVKESTASWWHMPTPTFQGSLEQAVEKTEQLLSEAVRDHLVADVPVGVFLSAGIDSTILASFAHQHNKDVRAFTIAVSEDVDLDELTIATETARRIGIEHVPVTMLGSHAEDAAFEWLAHADQPSIDGLNTFVISKAVSGHGIKVAISGLGADELFGGYPSFVEVPKIASVAKWFNRLPRAVQSMASWAIRNRKSSESAEKLIDMLRTYPSIARLSLQRRRLMNDQQMNLLGCVSANGGFGELWLPAKSLEKLDNSAQFPGWTISKMECNFYQGNTLLRDSDANSMASSLEIRVPFLDQRLLNWLPSLPDSIRFPASAPNKFLLREAGKRHLDKVHIRRPKSGFTLPIHRWMIGPMRTLCMECLDKLKSSSHLNPDGIDTIWNGFIRNPTLQASSRALALVVLGASLRFRRT